MVTTLDDKGAAESRKWIKDAVIDERSVVVLFELPDLSPI